MRKSAPVRIAAAACAIACACPAQQLIGYVSRKDAAVTGWSDEVDGQAVLTGSSSITTRNQAAPVKLSRGGSVRVCQTTELKITASRDVTLSPPLLFSLDHGSIQIDTNATPSDQIMTPDLRFTIRTSGALDLRLRVARNGDTCVENRGAAAPTIAVSDAFGESLYEVPAGQHVLFPRGSVRQVQEHESSPCGCPQVGVTVAEALLDPGTIKHGEPETPAAARHPFPNGEQPTAESAAPPQAAPPSTTPVIGEALTYSAELKDPDELTHPAPAKPTNVTTAANAPVETTSVRARGRLRGKRAPAAPAAPAIAPPPAPQREPNDLVHLIGRAFKRLFGG